MDPYARQETFLLSFDSNMYEPLVRRDKTLKLEPALAVSWSQPNPTTWRFKLRQGVKFHDGSPFTADDVVFSFDRVRDPGSNMKTAVATVKEVKKIDDFTVDFITNGPDPILPDEITTWDIMSKAWCEKNNTAHPADITKNEESYATNHANGTGPFVLKEREPDVKTVLVPIPGWWDKPQHNLDRGDLPAHRQRLDARRGAALGRGRHDLYRAAAGHRPDRQDQGLQDHPGAGAAHHLPGLRRVAAGAAGVQHQGQEPLQGQARAPGLLPGDRRAGDHDQGDARRGARRPP